MVDCVLWDAVCLQAGFHGDFISSKLLIKFHIYDQKIKSLDLSEVGVYECGLLRLSQQSRACATVSRQLQIKQAEPGQGRVPSHQTGQVLNGFGAHSGKSIGKRAPASPRGLGGLGLLVQTQKHLAEVRVSILGSPSFCGAAVLYSQLAFLFYFCCSRELTSHPQAQTHAPGCVPEAPGSHFLLLCDSLTAAFSQGSRRWPFLWPLVSLFPVAAVRDSAPCRVASIPLVLAG